MAAKMKEISLTKAEAELILNYIYENIQNGEYYGDRDKYWHRVMNVKLRLKEAFEKPESTPSVS